MPADCRHFEFYPAEERNRMKERADHPERKKAMSSGWRLRAKDGMIKFAFYGILPIKARQAAEVESAYVFG